MLSSRKRKSNSAGALVLLEKTQFLTVFHFSHILLYSADRECACQKRKKTKSRFAFTGSWLPHLHWNRVYSYSICRCRANRELFVFIAMRLSGDSMRCTKFTRIFALAMYTYEGIWLYMCVCVDITTAVGWWWISQGEYSAEIYKKQK